jgi:hypothetical protein
MTTRDVAATLRVVSALRRLCLGLPHLPTPAEIERLRRFEAVAAAPQRATENDIEAIAAGWRRWWKDGQREALLAMAARLPAGLIDQDRRLVSYACGAARARDLAPSTPWASGPP